MFSYESQEEFLTKACVSTQLGLYVKLRTRGDPWCNHKGCSNAFTASVCTSIKWRDELSPPPHLQRQLGEHELTEVCKQLGYYSSEGKYLASQTSRLFRKHSIQKASLHGVVKQWMVRGKTASQTELQFWWAFFFNSAQLLGAGGWKRLLQCLETFWEKDL